MVRIYGSDIPNLSKIVEDAFDSIEDILDTGDYSAEFYPIDTDSDISMNDSLEEYIINASDE
jgi:hypothetical protein